MNELGCAGHLTWLTAMVSVQRNTLVSGWTSSERRNLVQTSKNYEWRVTAAL